MKELKEDNKLLEEKVKGLIDERNNLEEEKKRMNEEKNKMIEESRNIKNELVTSRNQMKKIREDNEKDLLISKLQKKIKKLEIKNKALESVQPNIPPTTPLEESKGDITPEKTNNDDTQYKLQTSELKSARDQLRRLAKRNDTLSDKLNQIKQQLDITEKALETERKKSRKLEDDKLYNKKRDLKNDITSEELLKEFDKIQDYKNEIFYLQEENERLKKQINVEEEQKRNKLLYRLECLQNDVDKLEADNQRLRKVVGDKSVNENIMPYTGEDRVL